jgi:hypothetical protein
MPPTLKSSLRLGAAIALCAHADAQAQMPDVTKVPAERPAAEIEAPQPVLKGVTIGPFDVDAKASAGMLFSDNIFVTKNHQEADWIATFSPGVSASLIDGVNMLALRAGADFGRHIRFTSENYEDYYVGGDGRIRIDEATSLFAGAQYGWTHESRESPDAVDGLKPTLYRTGEYYAGLLRSSSDVVVRAGGTATTYAYDDVMSSGGLIENGDRDRAQYEAGARVSYRLTPTLLPFAQAYWDKRDYDRIADDLGFRRSSSGYRAALGVGGTLLSDLKGDVYAGIIGQTYDDARFDDVVVADFGARLTWRPLAGMKVEGFVDRTVEETTIVDASGYLRTAAGAALEQEIRPDLRMSAHLRYSENDYQGIERIDHVSDAGLGLKYFLTPHHFVATDYTFLHRRSTTAEADFYENRVWLRVGSQLAPTYGGDASGFARLDDAVAPGGAYIAALAGNGTLVSAVDGPRGSGGTLVADFGANGWQGDAAAGYGTLIGRVYLGAEVDAAAGAQRWLHGGTGGTRIFGVRKLASYELAARLGYRLRNNALLYGRFGAVASEFATPYQQGANYARPTGFQRGLRIGAGAEFPLVDGLAGRMEYSRTAYADYEVRAAANPDNFADSEDLMRFGIVRYLSGTAAAAPASVVDYSGAYAGLQGGFGGLISQNAGDRNFGQTLNAQRADFGATGGLFAGIGATSDDVYAGAELEAEYSNADWNIKRDPNGRIYSVEKDHTIGGAARVGYIFNFDTLVYGRVGYVWTQFQNKYHDEHGVNFVTPRVTRGGLRFGGGAELPVDDVLLRFDYTWTRYGGYRVDYVTGVDTFRNSENLFRVGIAVPL